MKLQSIIATTLVAVSAFVTAQADPTPMPAPLAEGQKFVQGFYDYYVPKALANKGDQPAEIIALKERAADFDPKLAAALKEDMAAQAKVSDDIVGLDFDPFLNAQDLSAKYVTGAARWNDKPKTLSVDVHSVEKGKRAPKPDVVPEISFVGGHWQFVNFAYPGQGELLSILAQLKAEREKSTKGK